MVLGFEPKRTCAQPYTVCILYALLSENARETSPFWRPGMRVVLNIFSYWAEHKGRIPISRVCKRPWAQDDTACQDPHGHTATGPQPPTPAHGLGRGGSHRQDLLAVQPVAVEEEGMDGVSRTSGLHWCGSDVQEVLGASRGDGKMPGIRSGPCSGHRPQTQMLTPTVGKMVN